MSPRPDVQTDLGGEATPQQEHLESAGPVSGVPPPTFGRRAARVARLEHASAARRPRGADRRARLKAGPPASGAQMPAREHERTPLPAERPATSGSANHPPPVRTLVAYLTSPSSNNAQGLESSGRRADRTSVECVGRSFSDDHRPTVAPVRYCTGTGPGVDRVERLDQPARVQAGRTYRPIIRRGPVCGVDDFVRCVARFGQFGRGISTSER